MNRYIIVVVEGTATKLFSDDGHVTITEEICTLTSTQEETDSRIILYAMYAAANGYTAAKIRSPDSDVFFILLNFCSNLNLNVFFESGFGNKKYCVNLTHLAAQFGTMKCKALLGLHAFTHCDSTSAFKGKGKAQLTKSRSENVLITSFLGYKTLDSNVMATSIMESFLYGLQNVIV